MAQGGIYLDATEDEQYQTQPVPYTDATVHQGRKVGAYDRDAALAQAKGIYGNHWDADAEQDFTQRYNSATPLDQLLSATQSDVARRFPSQGGGGGGQQAQTPTQAWNAQPAQPDPRSAELYQLLMSRAQQGTAIGRDNTNVRAQVDPAVAQMERASRNALDDIAEKAGPLANLTGERRLAAERTGQAAGSLESEVIGREIAARRDEIAQAIAQMGGQLTAEQQLALQRELGYLNDAARTADRGFGYAQLSQNDDQFMRELALREWNDRNTWDYRWSGAGG